MPDSTDDADVLDRGLVSELVARGPCEMMQPARALAPLVVAPDAVLAQLDVVLPKLADTAATHGSDPRAWSQWVACVVAAGEDPRAAAARLLEHETSGLALWCFQRARLELGMAAYEAFLASRAALGDDDETELYLLRHDVGDFELYFYVDGALTLGASGRALRAFEATPGLGTSTPMAEVLHAALRFLDGALDAAGLRRIVDAHANGPPYDNHLRAARAAALQALGDDAAAGEVAGTIDASVVREPTLRRVLSTRFGAAFDAAVARADRKRRPRRGRAAGFVLARSRTTTPHTFAPETPPGPACRTCGHAVRTWFTVSLAVVPELVAKLPRWPAFPVPACLDCSAWMERHDYERGADGRLMLVSAAPSSSPQAFDDHASAVLRPQFAKLVRATTELAERPLDGECQLGGSPAWIQDPLDVHCPSCAAPMVFVFRFSAPNPFEGCPPVAGESGALYYFACASCPRLAYVAQWT
ncbi:MAG TPA: hypothetical protein VGG39_34195 [Polyangiaceae bacterium]